MTNEMSLEIVQKAASPRRVKTLGGQFRKLPELTVHRPVSGFTGTPFG